jgi:hypothetical protein
MTNYGKGREIDVEFPHSTLIAKIVKEHPEMILFSTSKNYTNGAPITRT